MSLKSQTRDPMTKVPPGELVFRIFTFRKNPSTSAEFEPANLGSRGVSSNPKLIYFTFVRMVINTRTYFLIKTEDPVGV